MVLGDLVAPGAPGGTRGHCVRDGLCFPGKDRAVCPQAKPAIGAAIRLLCYDSPHRTFCLGRGWAAVKEGSKAQQLWVMCPCLHTAWRSTPSWIMPLAAVSGPTGHSHLPPQHTEGSEATIGGNPSKALSITKEAMGSFPLCFLKRQTMLSPSLTQRENASMPLCKKP